MSGFACAAEAEHGHRGTAERYKPEKWKDQRDLFSAQDLARIRPAPGHGERHPLAKTVSNQPRGGNHRGSFSGAIVCENFPGSA